MERIKRLCQEGIGTLYGESVPPIVDQETYLLSTTSYHKLIEIFEQIEEVAMGYNKTPQAFEKVKNLLDEMLEADKDIAWIFDNPRNTRMNIYEGLNYAVRSKKEELEKYSSLLDKFKLKVIEPNILKAELKVNVVIVPNGRINRRKVKSAFDLPNYKTGNDYSTQEKIIAAWEALGLSPYEEEDGR